MDVRYYYSSYFTTTLRFKAVATPSSYTMLLPLCSAQNLRAKNFTTKFPFPFNDSKICRSKYSPFTFHDNVIGSFILSPSTLSISFPTFYWLSNHSPNLIHQRAWQNVPLNYHSKQVSNCAQQNLKKALFIIIDSLLILLRYHSSMNKHFLKTIYNPLYRRIRSIFFPLEKLFIWII